MVWFRKYNAWGLFDWVSLFDGREEGENNAIGLVEIPKIIAKQEESFLGTISSGSVKEIMTKKVISYRRTRSETPDA